MLTGAAGGIGEVTARLLAERGYDLALLDNDLTRLQKLAHSLEDSTGVLALAGDPPKDGSDPGGDFVYATELVALAREVGDFAVGVAAFPEVHPRSPDRATDRRFLAAKLAAADFGMTQFFWDVDHYRTMVDELAALGCTTPVLPGVMPFVSVAGARRMSAMNNTHIPRWLQERMDAVADDPEATRQLGVEVAVGLVEQLLALDVPGIHLYAMNRAQSIQEIYEALGLHT